MRRAHSVLGGSRDETKNDPSAAICNIVNIEHATVK